LEENVLDDSDINSLIEIIKPLLYYGHQVDSTSESDTKRNPWSDTDSDNEIGLLNDKFYSWKVRMHALTCLFSLAKKRSKLFYGYWNQFLGHE
jgi:hypothetical protein